MRKEDTHAKRLRQFIEDLLLSTEDIKPPKPHAENQKHLLGLTDMETDYATSHIAVRVRETENMTYIWAGWHPDIETSHLFLSSHTTDNNIPHPIRKPVSLTISHDNINNENWWWVATSLTYCYFPSYESPPVTRSDHIVAAVAFWLESIASEITRTEPPETPKKPEY